MTRGDSPDEYLDKLLLPAPRAAEQRGEREETGTICRQRRRRHGERIGAAETCPRARRVAGEGGGAGEYEWAVGGSRGERFQCLLRGGQTELGKNIASA